MRAIAIDEFGGRERLHAADLPDPKVAPDGVLVRVRAAGVNPVDWKIREGRVQARFPHVFPVVLGWDAAGVVEQVGPAARGVEVGDEVYAYCRKHFVGEGAYAEYVSLPDAYVAPRPRSLSWEQAGAVPLAGLTAYQAIELLAPAAGQTVLVHAAAETVDYAAGDPFEAVRAAHPDGVDAVLDPLGGDTLARSAELLREGGRLVSIAEPPDREALAARGIEGGYVFVRSDAAQLRELGRMLDEGALRVHLERVFPLGQAAQAHELIEQGHVTGKLVLGVD